jgi:hypothetical protein
MKGTHEPQLRNRRHQREDHKSSPAPVCRDEVTMSSAERTKRFEPLGYRRRRILPCLSGDRPSLPSYLNLGPDEDVFGAFRAFVQKPSLPLLANLPESARWHARSSEQAALRAWLEKHRSRLVWDEARSQYQIASGNITRGKKPE